MQIHHDSKEMEDLVIKSMLAHRSTSLDNVDPESENERIRRLQTLLKTSKKYRRLSVNFANSQWESEFVTLSDDCCQTSKSKITKVSFSDSIQVIPDAKQKRMSESLIKIIKSIFKLGKVHSI